jgi:hypothetical protein
MPTTLVEPWGLAPLRSQEPAIELDWFHPSTTPDVIRGRHQTAVAAAILRRNTHDLARLSKATCLPVWNVKRAMIALGHLPPDPPKVKRATPKKNVNGFAPELDRIIALLSDGQARTASAIAAKLGMNSGTVRIKIGRNMERFVRTERPWPQARAGMRKTAEWWELRKGGVT